jgi:hypothetical protein
VLWETYCKQYGPTGDALTLVAHGASKVFNPTLPQRVIDRALEKDRAKATAEYLAEFRTDLEGFVTLRARVRRGGRSLLWPRQTTLGSASGPLVHCDLGAHLEHAVVQERSPFSSSARLHV